MQKNRSQNPREPDKASPTLQAGMDRRSGVTYALQKECLSSFLQLQFSVDHEP